MARHKAREQTLQMLFEWDLRRRPLEEISRGYYESLLVTEDSVAKPRPDAFARNLLQGVTEEPAAIVIDEALELARRFAGEESVQFVNGVLDAVRKELPARLPLGGGAPGQTPSA